MQMDRIDEAHGEKGSSAQHRRMRRLIAIIMADDDTMPLLSAKRFSSAVGSRRSNHNRLPIPLPITWAIPLLRL